MQKSREIKGVKGYEEKRQGVKAIWREETGISASSDTILSKKKIHTDDMFLQNK